MADPEGAPLGVAERKYMFYLYLLQSLISPNKTYLGVTNNLDKRLLYHNKGSNRSTKLKRPWKIVYTEQYDTKTKAMKREWHLKHPSGYQEKLKILRELKIKI